MDQISESLIHHMVARVVLPYSYESAEQAAEKGDYWSMKAMWNDGTKASVCAEIAAKHGNLIALEWLMCKNRFAVLYSHAMKAAAAAGHFKMVKMLHRNGAYCKPDIMDYAASSGHIKMMKWLGNRGLECTGKAMENAIMKNQFEMVKLIYEKYDEVLLDAMNWKIAETGNLEMIKWFRRNYSDEFNEQCMIETALEKGHLHVAKWIWETKTEEINTDEFTSNATNEAINLEVIKWIFEDHGLQLSSWDIDYAFEYGDFKCIEYICINMKGTLRINTALIRAASVGKFDIVKWVYENHRFDCTIAYGPEDRVKDQEFNIDKMVETGNLEMLQWFYERRDMFGEFRDPISYAAIKGHLHIIEWLYSVGYVQSAEGLHLSIVHDRYNVTKWLILHGFEADNMIEKIFEYSNLDMLKWLLVHGYELPCNAMQMVINTNNRNYFELVKYLHSIGQQCTVEMWNESIRRGNLEVAQWMLDIYGFNFKHVDRKVIDNIIGHGELSTFIWLKSNDLAVFSNNGIIAAVKNGYIDMVIVLHQCCDKFDVNELLQHGKNERNGYVIAYLNSQNKHPKILDYSISISDGSAV